MQYKICKPFIRIVATGSSVDHVHPQPMKPNRDEHDLQMHKFYMVRIPLADSEQRHSYRDTANVEVQGYYEPISNLHLAQTDK
jgi:hypothetical protein